MLPFIIILCLFFSSLTFAHDCTRPEDNSVKYTVWHCSAEGYLDMYGHDRVYGVASLTRAEAEASAMKACEGDLRNLAHCQLDHCEQKEAKYSK